MKEKTEMRNVRARNQESRLRSLKTENLKIKSHAGIRSLEIEGLRLRSLRFIHLRCMVDICFNTSNVGLEFN